MQRMLHKMHINNPPSRSIPSALLRRHMHPHCAPLEPTTHRLQQMRQALIPKLLTVWHPTDIAGSATIDAMSEPGHFINLPCLSEMC